MQGFPERELKALPVWSDRLEQTGWDMKIFLVALSLALVTGDEPSEQQMKGAFSEALTTQVRNVLEFVGETEGSEAVAKLLDSGYDRFDVNAFQKLQCRPDERGYLCEFAVDIKLVNGPLQRTITGRFVNSPEGLVYLNEV